MCSKDRFFVWDAKTLVRTLDKMNNTRPIIKIFLFPFTERTERIFSSSFPTFLFLPAHVNSRYAKMVLRLRIGNKYISRDYYSGAKTEKKTFKRTEKINK